MLRGQGGSWAQPGDPLIGEPTAHLGRIADKAAADADAMEHAVISALRIDTDAHTVHDAADVIVAQTGWPGGPYRQNSSAQAATAPDSGASMEGCGSRAKMRRPTANIRSTASGRPCELHD